MLDPKKVMIVCKGEDKTFSVESYAFDAACGKCRITYTGGREYQYDRANVSELKPRPYDCEGKHVFYKGEPVKNFEQILLFADARYQFLRVFKNNGTCFGAPKSSFTISESAVLPPDGQKIFAYLRAVAGLTGPGTPAPQGGKEDRSFLAKLYDRLDFIHPESVLAAYLERRPTSKRAARLENVIFPFRFNLSQKAALENALTHSVSVIEGPPGTGKTQTILNILANLTAMQGKSVGVVSFNNEAVKNVKDKLVSQGYGFLVAALGRAEKRQAFFKSLPAIDVAGWECEDSLTELQKKIKTLNETLVRLLADDNRRAQLRQELAAFQLEQRHFDQYYLAQQPGAAQKPPFTTHSSRRVAEYLADVMLEDKLQPGLRFLHKLKLLFTYGDFRWGKLKEDETDALLRLQKRFYDLKIQELEKEIQTLSERLQNTSFATLQDEHQNVSERIFRKKLFTSHGGLKPPSFSAESYKTHFEEFSRYYPILLSTNHSLRNSLPADRLLDYIIIDEASQVDLLTGALALSCCRNLIIVGDLKQLPQIVDEKLENELTGWNIPQEYDYFKQSILSSFICLYAEDLPRVILKEHYRCHPKIIQFCNQKYYSGELIPFTDPNSCHAPLMLYRLPQGNHMRTVTHGDNTGNYSQRELDVIKEEVLQNVALASYDIGMATPYRNQVRKASACLPGSVKSDTIHKFQGREKDVIIMSTVLDSSARGKKGLAFVDEACMVNVAVSRAKKQFILVTDDALFQNSGRHIHDLLRYIQYNTLDAHLIESQVVSIFDLLYKDYSEKLERLKSKILYRSRFASENIMYAALDEIFSEPRFSHYSVADQVLLRNLVKNCDMLDAHEASFINRRASVDFVIYHKQDKRCVLIIEVDGFAYHEDNPEQRTRDALKNSILNKCGIPLLRLPTNGSGEIDKVKGMLDAIERGQPCKNARFRPD